MKDKVMIVSPTLFLGGAEKVSVNICNMLAQQSYDVLLVVLDASGALFDLINPKVTTIELQNKKASRSWFELAMLIKKEKPKVVLSNTVRMNVSLLLGKLLFNNNGTYYICREPNEPARSYSHYPKIVSAICKRLYKKADLIIAQNEHMQQLMCDFYGRSLTSKIKVLKNPISVNPIIHKSNYDAGNAFVFVGRLTMQKNVLMLIEAYKYARDYLEVTYDLFLFGDGEEKTKIQQAICKYDLGDFVKLYPPTLDIHGVIRDARALILISLWEGSPNVVWESLTLGTPVIVSPILPEYITVLANEADRGHVLNSKPDSNNIVAELAETMSKFEKSPKVQFTYSPENNKIWKEFFSAYF